MGCCNSTSSNIQDLTNEQIENLPIFSFDGLNTIAKIIRIIDGDTVDMAFYVPYVFLSKKGYIFRKDDNENGFYTRVRCRLEGLDAAEHNTHEGIIASLYLEKILKPNKNYVWIQCRNADKYGRLLVNIYLDSNYINCINIMMCNYEHSEYGKVCKKYDGTTKSDDFKKLTKLTPKEQKEFRDNLKIDSI